MRSQPAWQTKQPSPCVDTPFEPSADIQPVWALSGSSESSMAWAWSVGPVSGASGPAGARGGLGLDRGPGGAPANAEMTGQRRDGGVVMGEGVGDPGRGTSCRLGPATTVGMVLGERADWTRHLIWLSRQSRRARACPRRRRCGGPGAPRRTDPRRVIHVRAVVDGCLVATDPGALTALSRPPRRLRRASHPRSTP